MADEFLQRERLKLANDETAAYAPSEDPGEATLVLPQARGLDDTLPAAAIEEPTKQIPEAIDDYRIIRLLGRGGMGLVYEAVQETFIQRHVALKIAQHNGHGAEGGSWRSTQRFKLEAALLARLNHPNIVALYDTGVTERGEPYYVMERVSGSSLRRHCDRLKLTVPQRLALFAELCDVVHYVNGQGIVHRNINPHNAMVATLGDRVGIKLIDFGIAKPLFTDDLLDPPPEEQGQLIGSLAYMSPEQALGQLGVDARTDVYALGVVLYELLSGRRPIEQQWQGTKLSELVSRIVKEKPGAPSEFYRVSDDRSREAAEFRRSTPKKLMRLIRGELDEIAIRCLRKSPEKRFATAGELSQRLRAWREPRSWWARTP